MFVQKLKTKILQLLGVEVNHILLPIVQGNLLMSRHLTKALYRNDESEVGAVGILKGNQFSFGIYLSNPRNVYFNSYNEQIILTIDLQTNEIQEMKQYNSTVDVELFKRAAYVVKDSMLLYQKQVWDDLQTSVYSLLKQDISYKLFKPVPKTVSLGEDTCIGGHVFCDTLQRGICVHMKEGSLTLTATKIDEYDNAKICVETKFCTLVELKYHIEKKEFHSIEVWWKRGYETYQHEIESFLKRFVSHTNFSHLLATEDFAKTRLNANK